MLSMKPFPKWHQSLKNTTIPLRLSRFLFVCLMLMLFFSAMTSPTNKLTSLLQYRFVRSDSKKNGSQSSDSDTQPPSETSTVPPSTPNKKPLSLQITPGI